MKFINNEKIKKINLTENNFFVAIDFDKTITSKESYNSWLACSCMLGEELTRESNFLEKKYYPIEQDFTISLEDKTKYMEEWYYGGLQLYYKYNLTFEKLIESIDNSPLYFRAGAKHFLTLMHEKNIPVIILSAGIGNVIERFLQNNNCYYENMFIISNFLQFDDDGKIKKYDGELIHTLNKNMEGHLPENFEISLKTKKYGLLFGDVIEDKKMMPSYMWDKTISTIFFDENTDKRLEVFKDNFDIVLTNNDATFYSTLECLHLN